MGLPIFFTYFFKFTYTNLVSKCRLFTCRSDILSFVKIIGTKTCVFDVKCRRGQNSNSELLMLTWQCVCSSGFFNKCESHLIPSVSIFLPNYSNHSRAHWPDVTSNNVIWNSVPFLDQCSSKVINVVDDMVLPCPASKNVPNMFNGVHVRRASRPLKHVNVISG